MSGRIVIHVATNGETKVQTEGFTGTSCQAASRFIERALGSVTSEQLTQDYFQSSIEAGQSQLQQGEQP